jgi:hypothetical protein
MDNIFLNILQVWSQRVNGQVVLYSPHKSDPLLKIAFPNYFPTSMFSADWTNLKSIKIDSLPKFQSGGHMMAIWPIKFLFLFILQILPINYRYTILYSV